MASSKKNPSNPLRGAAGATSPEPLNPAFLSPEATVSIAPAAAARLSGGPPEKPGAAAETALPGWQSLGKDHKPTHITGKQGRREKKVRW